MKIARQILTISLIILGAASCLPRKADMSDLRVAPSHGGLYTWDNWLSGKVNIRTNGKNFQSMGRFSMEAPRTLNGNAVAPNDRHGMANIGFYVKTNTESWARVGTAVDIAPTWSGSTFSCKDCDFDLSGPKIKTGGLDASASGMKITMNEPLYMFYTERVFSPDTLGQRIVMGYFDAEQGAFYKMTDPVVDPRADPKLMNELGYFIESNEVISAWRDPFVMADTDGTKHMYFAARFNEDFYNAKLKKLIPGGYNALRNSTVGHAIFDAKTKAWKIQPPLPLPHTAVQFELPQIVKRNNKLYLFLTQAEWDVSTKANASNEVNRRHSLVGYSADSLDGDWAPMKAADGEIMDLGHLYGVTFKEIDGKIFVSAFLNDDVVMTNIAEVDMTRVNSDLAAKIKGLVGTSVVTQSTCHP